MRLAMMGSLVAVAFLVAGCGAGGSSSDGTWNAPSISALPSAAQSILGSDIHGAKHSVQTEILVACGRSSKWVGNTSIPGTVTVKPAPTSEGGGILVEWSLKSSGFASFPGSTPFSAGIQHFLFRVTANGQDVQGMNSDAILVTDGLIQDMLPASSDY
jgi:hypothetical protein